MRTLCFGGTFNPIHNGHLICARAAAEAAGFARVLLIPSTQPPHKPAGADIAPAHHRLTMCQLAVGAGTGLFVVDDLELRRTGPSYTLATVRELKARGLGEVNWLIGGDTLPLLPTWHQPDTLLAEADFFIIGRPGCPLDWQALPEAYRRLAGNVVKVLQIDISATDIRRRVAEGKSIDYLTPPAVAEYVRREGLYRGFEI